MTGVLERTLAILELLAQAGAGLELGHIAQTLGIPTSATHRLLNDLVRLGFVRQAQQHGVYLLTTKLVSMGLSYLSRTGIVDVAQPLLNELAQSTGELVRLSVVDGERLTWVARAQGARQGLRYDPDMGSDAHLSCSSSGLAWLSTLDDTQALRHITAQGLGLPENFGPNAPTTIPELLLALQTVRAQGVAITLETYAPGLSAISAPVRFEGQPAFGVITVAGPSARLTQACLQALAPSVMQVAEQLAVLSAASPFFQLTVLDPGPAKSAKPLPDVQDRRPIYAP